MSAVRYIVIDLFCGAGGVTTGFLNACQTLGDQILVAASINHDPVAIRSHQMNYPQVAHFTEDIRAFDITRLQRRLQELRRAHPGAKVILWASLECTNYSKAKGGRPRDADSRSLPDILHKVYDPASGCYQPGDSYIQLLAPDYILIENVVEFMAWGPVDGGGRPISKRNGQDWLRWRSEINALGYHDGWTELNAANFGAYTHRNRLFGMFARQGCPITFPVGSFGKGCAGADLFGGIQPWRAVMPVLDMQATGKSIFTRRKSLSVATLQRIKSGMVKALAEGEQAFLSLYYSSGGTYASLNRPAPVITTRDRMALVHLVTSPAHPRPCHQMGAEIGCATEQLLAEISRIMADHGISDIRTRFLTVAELLAIQGFPTGYRLSGSIRMQKKFIGNAVVPLIVQRWIETLATPPR